MLYISRKMFGEDNMQYGIVDTDDDSETVVTGMELRDIISKHDIKIEGVVTRMFGSYRNIESISVYQDDRYNSALQVKGRTMVGVDVRTFKDEITLVSFDKDRMRDQTSIILSRYGKRLNWQNINPPENAGTKTLIVCLDDNIQMEGNIVAKIRNIKFDLTRLTSSELLSAIYMYFIELRSEDIQPWQWTEVLVDTKERMRYWQCVYLMFRDTMAADKMAQMLREYPDWEANCTAVAKQYWNVFTAAVYGAVDIRNFTKYNAVESITVANVCRRKCRFPFTLKNFDHLYGNIIDILDILRYEHRNERYTEVFRLHCFLSQCFVPDSVKRLCIDLCNDFFRCCMEYCETYGYDHLLRG